MENIARMLFDLVLIFAGAKIMGQIFERIKQPPVIGEILAGSYLDLMSLA